MNDALNNILNRNSHRKLTEPVPSQDEMDLVFQAALRAPDHAWLRPSSFIEIQGEGEKNYPTPLLVMLKKILRIWKLKN